MALKILSKNNISCYNHESGLYFFSERGLTPEGELLCSVKIGVASDLSKRITQYKTHSCQLHHQAHHILTKKPSFCANWSKAEEFAHNMINLIAIGQPPYGLEWFYVSETIAFELDKDPWQIFDVSKMERLKELAKKTKNNNRFYINKTDYDKIYQHDKYMTEQVIARETINKKQEEEIQHLKELSKSYFELIQAYEKEKKILNNHYNYSIRFHLSPWWKRILMALNII